MKVKFCGFTDKRSVEAAIAQNCDFLGFVFCKNSIRKITPENAAKISVNIPTTTAKVAVVVDNSLESLSEIYQKFPPDYFQFHGQESISFLQEVKKSFPKIKIIKAFKVNNINDLNQVKSFEEVVELFLFDNKQAGSGKSFDWRILSNFSSKKNWFLSGGLNISNIEEAIEITGAKMVDISSGIEKVRGTKSPELIKELMIKMQKYAA